MPVDAYHFNSIVFRAGFPEKAKTRKPLIHKGLRVELVM